MKLVLGLKTSMSYISIKNLIILACFSPVIVGCSVLNKSANPKPQDINFQIFGTTTLNPDLQNIPAPMRIDIYELKEVGEFNVGEIKVIPASVSAAEALLIAIAVVPICII